MNLNEAFKELEILEEDTFNIQDSKDVEELGSLLNDDDTNEVVNIIDADAMEKNDLENSYAGKVILECDVCHSLCYKEPEEIVIEEDTVTDIECPYCYSNDGFKVIGKVCSFDDCNKDDDEDTDNLENDDDEKSEENKDETADKSIEESINWQKADFNSKEFHIYLPIIPLGGKMPLTIGVMPEDDSEDDEYQFYFMLQDDKNEMDYE